MRHSLKKKEEEREKRKICGEVARSNIRDRMLTIKSKLRDDDVMSEIINY